MSERPLFKHYPQLREALPFADYAQLPTPVGALAGLDGGAGHAWIKRDDLTRCDYGGNKIRKLEFVLGELRARGADHVYTFGATGTNAGLATALMCRQEGLACTVFLFDQPDSPTVRRNYAALQASGARLVHCHSLLRTVLAYYLRPARLSTRSYFLYAGCSNPVATFGYVNAGFELAEQIAAGDCPEPEQIYVAASSSGTLAGLTLGCALAGLKSQVVGIRVAQSKLGPFDACTAQVAEKQLAQALDVLARHIPELRGFNPPPIVLRDEWYGPGYGAPTPEAEQAITRFGEQDIPLERTYTGKSAAAFLEALDKGEGPILFWNTYNSRPLSEAGLQGVELRASSE